MQQYGVDGVFVQRFAVETVAPASLGNRNAVLAHCRAGANQFGRAYAVMYDLSGVQKDRVEQTITDWKLLVDRMRLGATKKTGPICGTVASQSSPSGESASTTTAPTHSPNATGWSSSLRMTRSMAAIR